MKSELVFAATQIVAAQCGGAKGEGMHKSPKLVSDAVDLAEMLLAEVEKRDAAAAAAAVVVAKPLPPDPVGAGTPPPKPSAPRPGVTG
jgi:hypothetical protein